MKIQIDTKAKVIRLEEKVKFDELVKVLNKLLPKEWKEYSLDTNSVIYWSNPIIWHYHYEPWHTPIVTYGDNGTGKPFPHPLPVTCEGSGVYNVECVIN